MLSRFNNFLIQFHNHINDNNKMISKEQYLNHQNV